MRRGPGRVRRLLHRASSLLLTLGAVAGVACLLLALAAPTLHVRPLVFRSGSMSPAIPTGSLALARETPAADLAVGDVVSVRVAGPGESTWVTHRVVGVDPGADGTVALRLQGDANPRPDDEVHRVSSAPRTFLHIPYAGAVVARLSSPVGVVLLALLVAHALGRLRRDPPGGRPPRDPGRRTGGGRHATRRSPVAVARAGVLAVGLALPVVTAHAAEAAWADPVAVSGTTLATVAPSPPTVSCGVLTVGSTTVTWTAVPHATGYRLHHGAGGATTQDVGAATLDHTFTGTTSGTFSVQAVFGSTSWLSASSNAKAYTSVVGLVGTCV